MSLDQNSATAIVPDDRVRKVSAIRRALIRPELDAICGTVLVFLFFAIVAPSSGMFSTVVRLAQGLGVRGILEMRAFFRDPLLSRGSRATGEPERA